MKFGTDTHVPLRTNRGDPLAPSPGQTLNLYNILVYDQILAKRMSFPSASV